VLQTGRSGFDSRQQQGFTSLPHQDRPGGNPLSYTMGTQGSFVGNKTAGEWGWPVTFITCRE